MVIKRSVIVSRLLPAVGDIFDGSLHLVRSAAIEVNGDRIFVACASQFGVLGEQRFLGHASGIPSAA